MYRVWRGRSERGRTQRMHACKRCVVLLARARCRVHTEAYSTCIACLGRTKDAHVLAERSLTTQTERMRVQSKEELVVGIILPVPRGIHTGRTASRCRPRRPQDHAAALDRRALALVARGSGQSQVHLRADGVAERACVPDAAPQARHNAVLLANAACCCIFGGSFDAEVCEQAETGGPSTQASWFTTHAKDRPLLVQLGGSDPKQMLAAAQIVITRLGGVDGVDINFGCPQRCAAQGGYGAFLMDDIARSRQIVETLVAGLPVPVTAKIRILPSLDDTLSFARMLEGLALRASQCMGAGASNGTTRVRRTGASLLRSRPRSPSPSSPMATCAARPTRTDACERLAWTG